MVGRREGRLRLGRHYAAVLAKAAADLDRGRVRDALHAFERSWAHARAFLDAGLARADLADARQVCVSYLAARRILRQAPPRERLLVHRRFLAAARALGQVPAEIVCLNELGRACTDLAQNARAWKLHAGALQRALRHADRDGEADALEGLGLVANARGDGDASARLLTRCLELRERDFGVSHTRSLECTIALASVAFASDPGRSIELLEPIVTVLRAREEIHPWLIESLTCLGRARKTRGEYCQARDLLREALDLGRGLYGDQHSRLTLIMNELALVHHALGEAQPALELATRALAIERTAWVGDDHPAVAVRRANLGVLLGAVGEYARAEESLLSALDVLRSRYGDLHHYVASVLVHLAAVLRLQGRAALAEPLAVQALEIHHAVLKPDAAEIALDLRELELCRQEMERCSYPTAAGGAG